MNRYLISPALVITAVSSVSSGVDAGEPARQEPIATFSIVARDSATGELGVAVASKFFTVGNVVPWAKAGIGAVATQAFCNTSFGWRGLDMLETGMTPEQIRDSLLKNDNDPGRRQFGIVAADGRSVTYTGDGCSAWAGGRSGLNYAVQGNILAGEAVVVAMEKAFLQTGGNLADRMYAALLAGEAAGGDSRGKQSAALLVVREGAGYGGYTDRAIDIRIDDHPEPFLELGRILNIAQMNYSWNIAWTAFTEKRFADALPPMERCATLAPDYGEVFYDLAVIRLANGDRPGAREALRKAVVLNPKLVAQARVDSDLGALHGDDKYETILRESKE
ncbi:MAG: DUF1028 domain-containing protein [Candidatus Zixiibacteriota bacterium]